MKRKAAKKGTRTVRAKTTTTPGTFKPIENFRIPNKIQKCLHQLAAKDGVTFSNKFVVEKLAAIAGV